MSTVITVIEDVAGTCHLVVAGPDHVQVVPLDVDQAVRLGRLLLDGGESPTAWVDA